MNRQLSVPEMHQLRVARDTLKMSDTFAAIMGGPSKAEAVEIIERLTGRRPADAPAGHSFGDQLRVMMAE
jgi:hypothetical protein